MPLRVKIIRHWTVSELIFEVAVLSPVTGAREELGGLSSVG
jgi:hypothetical protein